MRGEAIVIVLLLTGCVAAESAGSGDAPKVKPTGEPRIDDLDDATPFAAAPAHPIGRAWTYDGIQQYNPDMPITVVVAEVRPDGYLFAGLDEGDLVYDVLWWNPLLGPRDAQMKSARDDRTLLAFPLEDGKTWAYGDHLTLTARAATIQVMGRSEEGFVIAGANERVSVLVEYSTALGQLTRRVTTLDGGILLDDHRLVKVEEGRAWTWYERGELVAVGSPAEPAAFDVPAGFDALLVSAGGTDGARAHVQAPSGAAWDASFEGAESWQNGVLPAQQGTWVASLAGSSDLSASPLPPPVDAPVGWAYMHVAPVKWLRP
jgi:hypothetical protein